MALSTKITKKMICQKTSIPQHRQFLEKFLVRKLIVSYVWEKMAQNMFFYPDILLCFFLLDNLSLWGNNLSRTEGLCTVKNRQWNFEVYAFCGKYATAFISLNYCMSKTKKKNANEREALSVYYRNSFSIFLTVRRTLCDW